MQASPDAPPRYTLKRGSVAQPVDARRIFDYNNKKEFGIVDIKNAHLNEMINLGACPGLVHVNAHISPDRLTCVHRFFRVQHGVVL